jgi:hypothetical protein
MYYIQSSVIELKATENEDIASGGGDPATVGTESFFPKDSI